MCDKMPAHTQLKFSSNRANDYMYDLNFIVPTEKDHKKHAFKATMATAQVEIAPVFANMFSELTHCPRQTVVMKVGPKCGSFIPHTNRGAYSMLPKSETIDVAGADRARFFKTPIITLSPDLLMNQLTYNDMKRPKKSSKQAGKEARSRGIQTIYRESSAQTSHWKTPDYVVMDDSDPEILKLKFLKENLPPGMHEVEMIIRARRRRAWELVLPDVIDAASLEKQRQILQAIELDQWAFREEEIEAIQALRMELLERMLQEILNNTAARTQGKIDRITARLHREHQEKLHKMNHRKSRELRRLYRQNFGVSTKYERVNVLEEHADYKSEMYAPLMRFGEHPKRGHEHIHLEHYEPTLYDVEHISTLPRWLYNSKLVNANEIKLPGRRLCIRETKWTEPVLKQLHEELKNLHRADRVKCTLREKRAKPQTLEDTVSVPHDIMEDALDEENEAVLILQCIIRGRAAQTLIYEGRDRCRELIEELQSTHFLDAGQNAEMRRRRMEVLGQQRNKQVLWEREANLVQVLSQLQGHVLGTMLDFLSKELVRVRDERKSHALAMMYERERRDREAAEAGRRQIEVRRRREHDEIFKQIVKVNQDNVDLYLQDIVTEGIEHVSDKDATEYVKKLAEQVEEKMQQPPTVFVEKEELIADMVCHFLIPEVEKQRLREKTKQRQQKHLRCAHEAIYNKMNKLPKIKDDEPAGCLEQSLEVTATSSVQQITNYLECAAEEQSFRLQELESPNIYSTEPTATITDSSVTEEETEMESVDTQIRNNFNE